MAFDDLDPSDPFSPYSDPDYGLYSLPPFNPTEVNLEPHSEKPDRHAQSSSTSPENPRTVRRAIPGLASSFAASFSRPFTMASSSPPPNPPPSINAPSPAENILSSANPSGITWGPTTVLWDRASASSPPSSAFPTEDSDSDSWSIQATNSQQRKRTRFDEPKIRREAELPLEERIRQQEDEIRGQLVVPTVSNRKLWAGFDIEDVLSGTHPSVYGGDSRKRDKPLPPIVVEDPNDAAAMERAQNTLAARKSRQGKMQSFQKLDNNISNLEAEGDHWNVASMRFGEDTPKLQQCKICKKAILKTAIAAHVEACVKAKNEKLKKKKEQKEAREREKAGSVEKSDEVPRVRAPTPQEIMHIRNYPSGKMAQATDEQIRTIFVSQQARRPLEGDFTSQPLSEQERATMTSFENYSQMTNPNNYTRAVPSELDRYMSSVPIIVEKYWSDEDRMSPLSRIAREMDRLEQERDDRDRGSGLGSSSRADSEDESDTGSTIAQPAFDQICPSEDDEEMDIGSTFSDGDWGEYMGIASTFGRSGYVSDGIPGLHNLRSPNEPQPDFNPPQPPGNRFTQRPCPSRSSSVESLQSLADSIFSIASLSSASTAAGTDNAFQRVLAILKSDAVLKELYDELTAKTSAGKFNRNFGILLKRFAHDLEKEAMCWNEQRAAQFIRSRARMMARKIADSVYPSGHESGKAQTSTVEQDKAEISEDSDLEEEPDEFVELERFITNSTAFSKLRDNIRGFSGLEPSSKDATFEVGTCTLLEELPFAGEDQLDSSDEPIFYEQCSSPYLRNAWHLPNFSQKIRDLLLPEPLIPDGMSRVRWKCPCGETLYDDYKELKPGAAKRMEEYLRRFSYKKCAGESKTMTERISKVGSSVKGLISSIGQRIQSIKSSERPAFVSTELRYYSDARITRTPAHTSGDVFYLLLCHNSGVGAEIVKLRQPDICDINNDQKLFSFLHEEYAALRKRWWSWISLWTLQSIKFVRFELHENELVDVKKLDEVPPPTKDNEYRHGPPNPPELNPPLGSALLMHLFKHPKRAGTKKQCLKKIPRKLRNRLGVIDEEDDAIGWGLQFIEGWSMKRLMYMAVLTFCLISFVVMILVSILGHDIQNAAAIASFMLSFVTIGIATAQAALHMN